MPVAIAIMTPVPASPVQVPEYTTQAMQTLVKCDGCCKNKKRCMGAREGCDRCGGTAGRCKIYGIRGDGIVDLPKVGFVGWFTGHGFRVLSNLPLATCAVAQGVMEFAIENLTEGDWTPIHEPGFEHTFPSIPLSVWFDPDDCRALAARLLFDRPDQHVLGATKARFLLHAVTPARERRYASRHMREGMEDWFDDLPLPIASKKRKAKHTTKKNAKPVEREVPALPSRTTAVAFVGKPRPWYPFRHHLAHERSSSPPAIAPAYIGAPPPRFRRTSPTFSASPAGPPGAPSSAPPAPPAGQPATRSTPPIATTPESPAPASLEDAVRDITLGTHRLDTARVEILAAMRQIQAGVRAIGPNRAALEAAVPRLQGFNGVLDVLDYALEHGEDVAAALRVAPADKGDAEAAWSWLGKGGWAGAV
ncbi:uncharacterized protein BXZ73DRAFT_82498 [Epithele typhae]|uniref:uncharacterized protein n=1 Tax=Epithele typhae TaxID=378194 RepID=UPI002008314D|nr:uncharacterized protein BXZ73DRAFT_82498 [Epithele typhae]KAH9912106.1 hypothetical protein BXZ73DRAFT_82498 [Epithele typhae]